MHLPAAGLRGSEFDSMAEPFENSDYSFARFGEESVVVTGDEEGYEQ
jgi:hypothetical protein